MSVANGKHEEITGVFWYKNNEIHREDGPAIEWLNGTKYWYKFGKLHREDGPAVERAKGNRYWYLFGRRVTELEFQQWKSKKELKLSLDNRLDEKISEKRLKI